MRNTELFEAVPAVTAASTRLDSAEIRNRRQKKKSK
jgi:hypothetical protein